MYFYVYTVVILALLFFYLNLLCYTPLVRNCFVCTTGLFIIPSMSKIHHGYGYGVIGYNYDFIKVYMNNQDHIHGGPIANKHQKDSKATILNFNRRVSVVTVSGAPETAPIEPRFCRALPPAIDGNTIALCGMASTVLTS